MLCTINYLWLCFSQQETFVNLTGVLLLTGVFSLIMKFILQICIYVLKRAAGVYLRLETFLLKICINISIGRMSMCFKFYSVVLNILNLFQMYGNHHFWRPIYWTDRLFCNICTLIQSHTHTYIYREKEKEW